ncbi:hypothetical protein IE53DRAFT_382278 [Violaceomyces palustris]|uniref:Uncharacterized protein n=1 Tax=Violaceomyces palustris TaxID=1673888 RepID=A0ACD0NN68_9BASI|nr:hypothetical protein IE53DRAFT_382278 [Violaceomyces palustris]
MLVTILIALIKLGLYIASSASLPWLFGKARHASLERIEQADHHHHPQASLPQPVIQSSSSRNDGDGLPLGSLRPFTPSRLDLPSFTALLFSLSLEESATLFAMVLMEAAGIGKGSNPLWFSWRFSLLAVLAFALFIIPLGVCLLITYRSENSVRMSRRILMASVPMAAWIFVFFKVPLPAAASSDPNSSRTLLNSLLSRTAVIGVVFIAILSGSAASSATWDASESMRSGKLRPPTASDISLAQDSFQRTTSDLAMRRTELERLESRTEEDGGSSSPSWSLANLWNGSSRSREIKSLKSEIFGLSAIASAMRDDLDSMKDLHRREERSHTLVGRLLIGLDWVWAAYCAFRILISLLNLLIIEYKDSTPPDFISYSLAYILKLFDVDVDVGAWTRQISLLFIGLLIAGRMRYILAWLGSIFRAASTGVSTSFLVLFLAEVTTIYMLATLIQLRTSLPPSLSGPGESTASQGSTISTTASSTLPPPASLLSTLPSFQVVFGSLFDSAFLLAVAITTMVRYLTDQGRNQVGSGGVLFGGGMSTD